MNMFPSQIKNPGDPLIISRAPESTAQTESYAQPGDRRPGVAIVQRSPVIIIGMHRSGTSIITRLLESAGLMVGNKKDENHEALFFQRIDEWVLRQSGASWDHPAAIHDLLENAEIRKMTTDYISQYLMGSPRTISFLGWKFYLQYQTPSSLTIPWGWKCPISTYTLPLWLDLFPGAKVIHIYRHGVDVAQSLRKRALEGMKRTELQELYYSLPVVHWIRPKPGTFVESVRCLNLEGGLSLWEEYMREARFHVQTMGDRAIELKYEEFLLEPSETLRSLIRFCDLPAGQSNVAQLATRIKKERAYAFRRDPKLRDFANCVTQRLNAQQYGEQ